MLPKDTHGEYIKRINKVVDDGGKKASVDAIKKINLKQLLNNSQATRKVFLATVLSHSKELFGHVQTIGTELKDAKDARPQKNI